MIFALVAVAAAAVVLFHWTAIVASGVPIGYGEGAVVHAGQILGRGGDPYAPDAARFVSANYPPLAYVIVALGLPLGPFTPLRLANVVAACAVAGLVAWRARDRPSVAVALAGSFLALYPVAAWTPGDRVDLLAVALTGFAVASLASGRTAPFGALGALALLAKPTAAVPLLAVLLFLAWRERAVALRASASLAAACAILLAALLVRFDARGMYEHLVVYNAFPYDVRNPALLVVIAVVAFGTYVVLGSRLADGRMRAYVAGAVGVVLLGGHEGATINYLLDLAAASCLAIAGGRVAWPSWAAPALAGQLVAMVALTTVGPLAPPSLDALAARVALARELPPSGEYYAEDSGLLIAAGLEPVVDDPFVWARLVALGVRADDVTPRLTAGGFGAVISDVPLDRLGDASEVERLRWPADVARAVLARYALDRSVAGAYRYVPRR